MTRRGHSRTRRPAGLRDLGYRPAEIRRFLESRVIHAT